MPFRFTLWSSLAQFTQGIGKEFSNPDRLPQRLLDEAETLLSVLLAIGMAHYLAVDNVGWAAFSGYMVMRSSLHDCVYRGGLRIIGTAAGGLAAAALLTQLQISVHLLGPVIGLVGACTLWCAIRHEHGYAWLFAGLTFAMVAISGFDAPGGPSVTEIARTRLEEVACGTLACWFVAMLSGRTVRKMFPDGALSSRSGARVSEPDLDRCLLRHVLQAGLALALIPSLGIWLEVGGLSQAAITVMAVMMVPPGALLPGSRAVTLRNVHRLAGCCAGAACAGLALWLVGSNWIAMTLAMCIGVMAGRHIENSNRSYAYAGTQFSLVYLVVMVPDTYVNVSPSPGFIRLEGVLAGFVLIGVIRLANQLIRQGASR
ncbi:TPA: FUSC family protein [Pseudomonas putida]